MGKSFQEWLSEGEELYKAAVDEYRDLEGQMEQLQHKLAAKKTEVNQIAKVIGKPPIDMARPASGNAAAPAAEVVEGDAAAPYTRNSIARALTGQPLRR